MCIRSCGRLQRLGVVHRFAKADVNNDLLDARNFHDVLILETPFAGQGRLLSDKVLSIDSFIALLSSD
jgi:hypothetical protein